MFYKNQYKVSLENVKKYLSTYPNVFFYKGLFPKTSGPVRAQTFSFVHLDVDLYNSTKEALEFFYPRITRGGVIISHDYCWSKGVRTAFQEYFRDRTEPVIELAEGPMHSC